MFSKGIKWIVYSNIWVSLNVVALYFFVTMVSTISFSCSYSILVFFSTLFAYNFQRLLKNAGSGSNPKLSERHHWIREHQQLIKLLSAIGFLGMAILGFYELPLELILSSIPAFIIVLFYTRKNDSLKALRNLPFMKIFMISIVWVFVVLLIPFLMHDNKITDIPLILLVVTFLYVFLLCLPFDVRDISVDRERLKTIPVVLGVAGSKMLGIGIMLVIALLSYRVGYWGMVWVSLSIIPSLLLTSENRKELFFSGWIEGQFILLLLLQYFVEVI